MTIHSRRLRQRAHPNDFFIVEDGAGPVYPAGNGLTTSVQADGDCPAGSVVRVTAWFQLFNGGTRNLLIASGGGVPYPNLQKTSPPRLGGGGFILQDGLAGFENGGSGTKWMITYRKLSE